VLRSTLAKVGYQVDTAEDGVEAVKAVGRVAYDVVLMDGFMPNKTGWEATKEIRSEELARGDKKRLVIIGVTGATSREDEDKCFASGMTDVISKPVKREALQAKIEQWTTVTAASPAPKDEAAATVREETKAQQPASGNRQALIVSKDKSMQVMLKGVFKPIGIVCVFCDSQVSSARTHTHTCIDASALPSPTGRGDTERKGRGREPETNSSHVLRCGRRSVWRKSQN